MLVLDQAIISQTPYAHAAVAKVYILAQCFDILFTENWMDDVKGPNELPSIQLIKAGLTSSRYIHVYSYVYMYVWFSHVSISSLSSLVWEMSRSRTALLSACHLPDRYWPGIIEILATLQATRPVVLKTALPFSYLTVKIFHQLLVTMSSKSSQGSGTEGHILAALEGALAKLCTKQQLDREKLLQQVAEAVTAVEAYIKAAMRSRAGSSRAKGGLDSRDDLLPTSSLEQLIALEEAAIANSGNNSSHSSNILTDLSAHSEDSTAYLINMKFMSVLKSDLIYDLLSESA